ncbi:MAG TPA: GntR family transcriptional regulator, partial [Planctomycetaceae bacterium]|nr:GntR family transcriptional regulator [Planctomycetaceae bacterium]
MPQIESTANQSQDIVEQLRMEIITGRLEEGMPLREVSLAERFQ